MRPEDLHPAARHRQMRRRDAAFGGFLYLGSILGLAYVLRWIPVTIPGYWYVGSFLTFWGLVLAVPASLVGFAYTVVVRRERALWVLLALVLAVGPALASVPLLPAPWTGLVGLFFATLTVLSLALPLRWFLRRRRRWSRLSASEARTEIDRAW